MTAEQMREYDLTREAAKITLSRMKNAGEGKTEEELLEMLKNGDASGLAYQELNAEHEQQGNEKFKKLTQELWTDIVVSGLAGTGGDGKPYLKKRSDLDGEMALGMLLKAGIKLPINKDNNRPIVNFVPPGGKVPGKLHIDTSNRDGAYSDFDPQSFTVDTTAGFDHHTAASGSDTSATKHVYETMVRLGIIEKDPLLKKLVDFVTHEDNRTYPQEEKYYKKLDKTVLGLARYMKFTDLYEYFKAGRSPVEELSDDDLKKYNLEQRSRDMAGNIKNADTILRDMKEKGFVINTKFGEAVVDIGERVPLGFRAVKGNGYKTYIKLFPDTGGFFISTPTPMPEKLFPKGINVRGKMWITERDPKAESNQTPMTFKQVLDTITGTDFQPQGELKTELEKYNA